MAGATRGRQPCKGITLPPQVKLQAPTVNEGPPNFPDVCDALQAEMHQQRQYVRMYAYLTKDLFCVSCTYL